MKKVLVFLAFVGASAFAAQIRSLSPYDVVLPSLNGDPASTDRVVGQMYFDVSSSKFKAIDNAGAVKFFALGDFVDLTSAQEVGGVKTFSSNLLVNGVVGVGTDAPEREVSVSSAEPTLQFIENDASTNNRRWQVFAGSEDFYIQAQRDSDLNGFTAMRISRSGITIDEILFPEGNFVIGGAVQLTNYGAGTLTTDSSGNVTATSDERMKDIIRPFVRGLAEIKGITPITYKWRQGSGLETFHEYSGFSAQNVQANIPEAVGMMKNGNLTLQDRALMATMINAIKELNRKIEVLEKKK